MSMATTKPSEIIEGEFEVEASTTLAQLNSSEIDVQIATANKYPRSITRFRQQVLELATLDEDTAGQMFYKLPRGRDNNNNPKFIEGPSIRLAEIAAASYKNLRFGSRIIQTEDRFITAQGFCHDLENNIAVAVEVRRRITGKNGERFNDDMIQVTGAAASSIALRNAIFRIIPKAYYHEALEKAKLTCLGKNKTMAELRKIALDWFKKKGATDQQVFDMLNIKGEADLGEEELVTLRGLVNAIKEGSITLENALAKPDDEAGAKVAESSLNDKLKKTKKPEQTKSEPTKPAGLQPANPIPDGASELLATSWKLLSLAETELKIGGLCDEFEQSSLSAAEKELLFAEAKHRCGAK